jgi:hypothetical protein
MDLGRENPKLRALCRAEEPLTLDEFIVRCESYLAELMSLHAGFVGLHLVEAGNPRRGPAVDADLSNLREWALAHSWDKQWRNSYSALDERGNPTPASTGGFDLGLSNWAGFDDKFSISVRVGPKIRGICEGSCLIVMPRRNHSEFLEESLPLQLLAATVRHWSIRYSDFTTSGLLDRVNYSEASELQTGTIKVGWLTYSDDPSVAESLPPGIQAQRMGKGIVFKLADRMPDFNNPDDVARATAVREALRAAGKLQVDPVK